MKRIKTISRTFEMVMGLIGSIIGIFSGSFFIFLLNFSHAHSTFLGIMAILGSLLGILSSTYVNKNSEMAGVGFIIATMFVIIGSDYINAVAAVFLLIAGISSLFRN